jgi:hypothetical protein
LFVDGEKKKEKEKNTSSSIGIVVAVGGLSLQKIIFLFSLKIRKKAY